jgi:hypothetical protein
LIKITSELKNLESTKEIIKNLDISDQLKNTILGANQITREYTTIEHTTVDKPIARLGMDSILDDIVSIESAYKKKGESVDEEKCNALKAIITEKNNENLFGERGIFWEFYHKTSQQEDPSLFKTLSYYLKHASDSDKEIIKKAVREKDGSFWKLYCLLAEADSVDGLEALHSVMDVDAARMVAKTLMQNMSKGNAFWRAYEHTLKSRDAERIEFFNHLLFDEEKGIFNEENLVRNSKSAENSFWKAYDILLKYEHNDSFHLERFHNRVVQLAKNMPTDEGSD